MKTPKANNTRLFSSTVFATVGKGGKLFLPMNASDYLGSTLIKIPSLSMEKMMRFLIVGKLNDRPTTDPTVLGNEAQADHPQREDRDACKVQQPRTRRGMGPRCTTQ